MLDPSVCFLHAFSSKIFANFACCTLSALSVSVIILRSFLYKLNAADPLSVASIVLFIGLTHLKIYETEKEKIKNIKPLQPIWEHPQWSDYFKEQLDELILHKALNRESMERWMVEHILQKSTAMQWKRSKQKKVNEFIERNDLMIKNNLKRIVNVKTAEYTDEFLGGSTVRRKISRCADKLCLKGVDIYDDVRKYALENIRVRH